MSLAQVINEDMKQAMRDRDKRKLEALRAIKSGLLLLKTGKDVSSGEIPETVEVQLLQKLVKQREESAALYLKEGREELAEEEQFQADVIKEYLPAQMSEQELRDYLTTLVHTLGAEDMKDMGRVMGQASKELAGKADNKKVAEMIRTLLAQ